MKTDHKDVLVKTLIYINLSDIPTYDILMSVRISMS